MIVLFNGDIFFLLSMFQIPNTLPRSSHLEFSIEEKISQRIQDQSKHLIRTQPWVIEFLSN